MRARAHTHTHTHTANFDGTSLTNKDAVSVKRYVPQLSMLTHVCDIADKGSRSSSTVFGQVADGWKEGEGGGGSGGGGRRRDGGGGGVSVDMLLDIDGPDGRTLAQRFEDVL